MKRSKRIILTILASASLMAGGCSDSVSTRRDIYASREKCSEDWNSNECDDAGGGRYYGPHYYYHGGSPYYFSRGSSQAAPVPTNWGAAGVTEGGSSGRAIGSTASHISRGGFGKTSGAHGLLSA